MIKEKLHLYFGWIRTVGLLVDISGLKTGGQYGVLRLVGLFWFHKTNGHPLKLMSLLPLKNSLLPHDWGESTGSMTA